jgi:serine/threonine-protein kinase
LETLAEVLVEAEASGVIHRDIKPSNVFRTRDGAIKLLDFGIAFVADEPIAHATATGMAMGTPAFMAPEQARGRKELMGAWSDQFSAAATVLTLLAGRPLRGGGTYAEDFAMAMVQPFPRAATLGAPIGPALGAVLDRAVSLDVGARFPSATSFLQAIRDARRTPALPLDEQTLRVSKPEIGTGTVRMGVDVARAVSAAVAAHGASKSPQPVPSAPGSRPSLPDALSLPVPRSWPSLPDDVPVPPAPRSPSALSEATPPPDRRRYLALGGAALVGVVVVGVALRSLHGSPTSPAANASVNEAVAAAPKPPEPLASAPVLPVPTAVTGPSSGTPERTSHSASTPAPTASVLAPASARTVPKPAYEVLSEPGSERVSDASRARVFLNAGNYTAVRTLLDPKARAGRADAEEKAILRAACKGLKDFECLARVH